MLRSHTCGELRLSDKGKKVQLSGWVQKVRDKGKLVWIDIRDRYGITHLIFEEENTSKDVFNTAKKCGREFVIFVEGNVSERSSKNDKLNTGEIEVLVDKTFYRFKEVFAAAGHPNSIFKISNLDLLKITNGKTLDISE